MGRGAFTSAEVEAILRAHSKFERMMTDINDSSTNKGAVAQKAYGEIDRIIGDLGMEEQITALSYEVCSALRESNSADAVHDSLL